MWIRRSHLLAPLDSRQTVVWKWGEVEAKAFRDMKKSYVEVMLAFPDFSKPFVIHTDASHTQLEQSSRKMTNLSRFTAAN
jgi:hypothetical protein